MKTFYLVVLIAVFSSIVGLQLCDILGTLVEDWISANLVQKEGPHPQAAKVKFPVPRGPTCYWARSCSWQPLQKGNEERLVSKPRKQAFVLSIHFALQRTLDLLFMYRLLFPNTDKRMTSWREEGLAANRDQVFLAAYFTQWHCIEYAQKRQLNVKWHGCNRKFSDPPCLFLIQERASLSAPFFHS